MITRDTRILIVDDSVSFRTLLKRSLVILGYNNFVHADNGFKALHFVQSFNTSGNKIGLILCDWNMPECSGLKFFKLLQDLPEVENIPFIMITSENEVGHVLEAVKLGVKYYIVKPPETELLRKKIEAINIEEKKKNYENSKN